MNWEQKSFCNRSQRIVGSYQLNNRTQWYCKLNIYSSIYCKWVVPLVIATMVTMVNAICFTFHEYKQESYRMVINIILYLFKASTQILNLPAYLGISLVKSKHVDNVSFTCCKCRASLNTRLVVLLRPFIKTTCCWGNILKDLTDEEIDDEQLNKIIQHIQS